MSNMKVIKSESIAEFLARGGKITYVSSKGPDFKAKRKAKTTEDHAEEAIDMNLVPKHLKLVLGLK